MAPSLSQRQKIAQDTIARSATITIETPGASLESTFTSKQLPALQDLTCPGITNTDLHVVNLDSFSAARSILEDYEDAKDKVAVLNLASDQERGGGWIYSLATTQVGAKYILFTIYEVHRYTFLGRSFVLLLNLVRNSQTILLPLAKSRARIRSGNILPFCRYFQR